MQLPRSKHLVYLTRVQQREHSRTLVVLVHLPIFMSNVYSLTSVQRAPECACIVELVSVADSWLTRVSKSVNGILCNGVARTVMHIKGKLLNQASVFFNCVPFLNWDLS